MAFGKFNTYEEVATKFNIKMIESTFVREEKIDVKPDIFDLITLVSPI